LFPILIRLDVDVDVAKEQDVLSRNRSIVNEVKKISRKEMVHSSYAEFSSDRENSSEPNDPIEENRSLFSKNLPEKSIPLNGNNKTVRDTEQKEYLPTLISLESLTPLAIPTPSIEDIAEPNFRLSKPKRKIEIYFNTGLAITNQIFKAKDASSNDYSSLRDFSENSLETYTYDIGVNIPVGKKSFVKIGGNYNVNYDKINYTYDAPKTFDFENVLIKIRKNPNNEVVEEIFGDTTVIGSETITNTLYNRYSSTNLEVSFGHYLFAKNRLSLAITGGLFYNISLKTKGKVISPENEQAGLVALDGYKKSFGLGLIGGADIDFKINESWMLNLRPTVSYGLFSATNQSNMLNANIHKYGISLGVKYKL